MTDQPPSEGSRRRHLRYRLDAEVRLLWRYPSRRMEAEVLRDSILAVSGVLDLSLYGPGFSASGPRHGRRIVRW